MAFNQPYQPTPLSNADLIATAVAQTVALNPQSQACAATAPTSTPTPYQYVHVTPTATPYPCNNSAIMVSETYPDHTQLDLNQYFNKSWRLKNIGTCTWSTGYRLAFYSGNSMSAPSYVNMPYAVPPGGIVDIVVPMRAPGTAGVYTGYWGLYTDALVLFGKVWVTIDVDAAGPAPTATNPPSGFAVTSVTYANVSPVQTIQLCGLPTVYIINIEANITTNGAGIVTYYWVKSDLTNTATQTLTYGGASTQTVLLTYTIVGDAAEEDYWVKIYVDNPNHQLFSAMNFHTTCM
ncbi:MAG TPA: hypothetical protein G4N92_00520 [Anaerolineae bacterium]|nr:hypothetical protein [Anaerolineae bacterium]